MTGQRTHVPRSTLNRMWEMWTSGASQYEIADALYISRRLIATRLNAGGGIAGPASRRRPDALNFDERCEIYYAIVRRESFRKIARDLGRSPSTVLREVNRNGGRTFYRPHLAEARSYDFAKRPQRSKLAGNLRLCRAVAAMLKEDLSPEQIAGRLKRDHPNDQTMQVSHETIYRTLYIQARGALKKELMQHLRRKQESIRQPHQATVRVKEGAVQDIISISERPPEADDRAVPGHWEGDLIIGQRNRSHVITLVERSSRLVMLIKSDTKAAEAVAGLLSEKINKLPDELKRSLAWDRGTEMARHKDFTVATNVPVYFCDPKSPWQRGSNENTNGLLRQYLPKTADLSAFSQEQLDEIAAKLNRRPRKTLDFMTPAEKLEEMLH